MMKALFALALGAMTLTACGSTGQATRALSMDGSPVAGTGSAAVMRNYSLADVRLSIPSDLSVSEANSFYPVADIVWRGDPIGPRHAQIGQLFQEAASRVGASMNGARPVGATITLVRFHGVTERTRYTVGGNYNIVFTLEVRDAATGAVIEPARQVAANLPAPGGNAALQLEAQGQTERVRVIDYLAFTLMRELAPYSQG